MKMVQVNHNALKASIASVVELIGQAISATQSGLDTKLKEIQTTVETLHQRVTATAAAIATGATAAGAHELPPGLLFSHELED